VDVVAFFFFHIGCSYCSGRVHSVVCVSVFLVRLFNFMGTRLTIVEHSLHFSSKTVRPFSGGKNRSGNVEEQKTANCEIRTLCFD
jgi:hypothetical protein